MQIVKSLLTIAFLCCLAHTSVAQVQQARGKATVDYKARSAPTDVKAKAQREAELKAIEFYYAEAGESEAANFDAVRDKIVENPGRYILETTVLSEEDIAAKQQYSVTVRVSLNIANLRNLIRGTSAATKSAKQERSAFAFLFVSRQSDSIKSFDDTVATRLDITGSGDLKSKEEEKTLETEKIKGGSVATAGTKSQDSSIAFKGGVAANISGSRTRRAAESTYRLIPSANLNQIFTATFARAGYKVSEAALVEPFTGGRFKVSAVEDDYKSGNDLKTSTLQSIVAGMKTAQIPLFAIGTLDVGLAGQDAATGLIRVAVTVNAKVMDVTQSIPETVAAVGPVQYAGVGPTEDEARTNALKLAATTAARELNSQLVNIGTK
jgi:hypothetical protein